jgi:hypothetical protein
MIIGLKGQQPIVDGDFAEEIKVESVNWVIEDKKAVMIAMDKVVFILFDNYPK